MTFQNGKQQSISSEILSRIDVGRIKGCSPRIQIPIGADFELKRRSDHQISPNHSRAFLLNERLFLLGDFSTKSFDHDSESTSTSSSCGELRIDEHNGDCCPPDVDPVHEVDDESDHVSFSMNNQSDGTSLFLYKCSQCEFTSNIPWTIQKHINELHPGQANAHMLTQSPSTSSGSNQKSNSKKSKHKNGHSVTMSTVGRMTLTSPLSPASALAKAKFSPAVEEALLSLQGSKFKTAGFYFAQPKFGIKRLKCRHCFYRSNWKTDMIRHVRIRHCLTEPDHNKGNEKEDDKGEGNDRWRSFSLLDMITMTEEEARSTIEIYENTFGKELRRRTFRTWNDWAKAEQEFTPKDGSLEYVCSTLELDPYFISAC